jgi:Heparinase II/III-like protein
MRFRWRYGLVLILAGLFSYDRIIEAGTPLQSEAERIVPWDFRADFRHGLFGWMSFPLFQDIGFDPTIITRREGSEVVLFRELRSYGEQSLSIGVIRPLSFIARPATRIRLRYTLRWASPDTTFGLILAGEDGKKYRAALPAGDGTHAAAIGGAELAVPSAGVRVEAIILQGSVERPVLNATSEIILREFEIQSFRPAEVPVIRPVLARGVYQDSLVATRTLAPGESLPLLLGPRTSNTKVTLRNGNGKIEVERTLSAAAAPETSYSIPLPPKPQPGLWSAELAGGGARTQFSFLVIGDIPAHPRLLLSSARLEQLRSAPELAGFRDRLRQQARAQAGKITFNVAAGDNLARVPVGRSLRPSFEGEINPYFDLLGSYADCIAWNALDYRLTGDRTSLDAARRALLTVTKWQTWTPPRFASHGLHTYYEVGVFSQEVAFGYDLIASDLSQPEKDEVAQAFWHKAIKPTVDEYFLYNRMPIAASNWMPNSLGGVLAAAAVVAGDVSEWRNREGVAVAELALAFEQTLDTLFPGDGSEVEPAGYHHFAQAGVSYGMAALRALYITPPSTAKMLEAFWWPHYAMVRPDLVLDGGDFGGGMRGLPAFAWGAEYGGIPALRAFYDRAGNPLVQPRSSARETGAGPGLPHLLDLVCCTGPAPAVNPPPRSRVFPLRGSAVLRSGFDPDSTVISLRAGPWFNHEHRDNGGFLVAAFGSRLIWEAGRAGYYNEPNYHSYFTQAAGHNTVLLDEDDFSHAPYNGRYLKAFQEYPRITEHVFSPAVDYVATNLAPAYEGRLSSYRRDFLFLPPDMLIIYDELQAPQPHTYTWLLHPSDENKPVLEGNRARIETRAARAVMTAAGSAGSWDIKTTPVLVGIFRNLERGKLPERYVLRLASGKANSARFLVGMQFSPQKANSVDSKLSLLQTTQSANSLGLANETHGVSMAARTGTGDLSLETLNTDGVILAVKRKADSETWLATKARSVLREGQKLFSATHPASVSWQESPNRIELNLYLSAAATVEIRVSSSPARVLIDGTPGEFGFRSSGDHGFVVISRLSQGGHLLSLSTRTAP